MPTQYTGVSANQINNPVVVFNQPLDGDPAIAASVDTATGTLADATAAVYELLAAVYCASFDYLALGATAVFNCFASISPAPGGVAGSHAVVAAGGSGQLWCMTGLNTEDIVRPGAWLARTSNIAGNIFAATSNNSNLFVVAGAAGALSTSPDGVTWTARTSQFLAGETINAAIWTGTQFVIVGGFTSGRIATSPDGITWTLRANPNATSAFVSIAIAPSGGLLVASGGSANGNVYTSPDGITWTARPVGGGIIDSMLLSTHPNASLLVLAGSTLTPSVWTSPDGITWTQRPLAVGSQPRFALTHNGRFFYGLGGNSGFECATSADGITWTRRFRPSRTGVSVNVSSSGSINSAFNLLGSILVGDSLNNGRIWYAPRLY